jgi:mRNA-degrading endonuclease HigB of HigAB toxin-antitoxin module
MEKFMRFVGLTEIATFVAQCPDRADAVRAWLTEMKHRNWANAAALASDFANADASELPVIVFYLGPQSVRIETLIDFRNGIVMLTKIHWPAMMPGRSRQSWMVHRDH